MELEKFNGVSFKFAKVFTCYVSEGVVFIEQYEEGPFELPHIKTESQLIQLYEILTGKEFNGWRYGFVSLTTTDQSKNKS